MSRRRIHSSRRAAAPKDSDFDHEIVLVDHTQTPPGSRSLSDGVSESSSSYHAEHGYRPFPLRQDLASVGNGPAEGRPSVDSQEVDECQPRHDGEPPTTPAGPSVYVQEPTSLSEVASPTSTRPKLKAKKTSPESAIDILYENQRGGFLCGIALFSSRALGNIDPPPWTNSLHKPSPTDIHTAQVPDPSWEWAWPAWRVNQDEGSDADGWEYSFAFNKKFSWHGPRWWNSFVRRRAWIRKRVKKDAEYASHDIHMLNSEYFTVGASMATNRERSWSRDRSRSPSSHRESRVRVLGASTGKVGKTDETEESHIEDIEKLLRTLRASRIDREKIEAVENYLQHARDDLASLADEMHEIMALFVFQASRRILLERLTAVCGDMTSKLKKNASDRLKRRADYLAAAVKHATEAVDRLECWSVMKGTVEEGETEGGVDKQQGSNEERRKDVDRSGPAEPCVYSSSLSS